MFIKRAFWMISCSQWNRGHAPDVYLPYASIALALRQARARSHSDGSLMKGLVEASESMTLG